MSKICRSFSALLVTTTVTKVTPNSPQTEGKCYCMKTPTQPVHWMYYHILHPVLIYCIWSSLHFHKYKVTHMQTECAEHLVGALRHKTRGRGLDSWWVHWYSSSDLILLPTFSSPGAHSASNRSVGIFLRVKGWQPSTFMWRMSENPGILNPLEPSGPI
jgi:hypothetical protein